MTNQHQQQHNGGKRNAKGKHVDAVAEYTAGVEAEQRGEYAIAFRHFTTAVEGGSARAQYSLAMLRLAGKGAMKNPRRAVELLELAAEQGHEDAIRSLPGAWKELIKHTSSSRTISINGKRYDGYERCIKTLQYDPRSATAWLALSGIARSCSHGVFADGAMRTSKECLFKAVGLNPRSAKAWNEIGAMIGAGSTRQLIVNNETMTQRDCYMRAVDIESDNATGWVNIGKTLTVKEGEQISIKGQPFTVIDCYLRAIEVQPNHGGAWEHLGGVLANENRLVRIRGQDVDKREAYVRAVTYDSSLANAWIGLGDTMMPSETITILGKRTSRMQAHETALRIDPNSAAARHRVETTRVAIQSHDYEDAMGHLRSAIEAHPHNAWAWRRMAEALDVDETRKCNKQVVGYRDCLTNALLYDSNMAVVWLYLGCDMLREQQELASKKHRPGHHRKENRVHIGNASYTTRECFLKAIELDSKDARMAMAWSAIGKDLPRNGSVFIGETEVCRAQCFIRAIDLNPHFAVTWKELGSALSEDGADDDAVLDVPNFGSVGRRDCYEMAHDLDPRDEEAFRLVNRPLRHGPGARQDAHSECCVVM